MTDHFARPDAPATSPSNARDLRNLLEAVLEALTLPYDTPDYDQRILNRAAEARVIATAALAEDPADIGWNVDFLRAKLTAEQADAEPDQPRIVRHANGLEFTVIPADSYDARMARDVRELTMDDGSVWTVGTRGAGSAYAWQPQDNETERARQFVDRHFPTVAAFLAEERGEHE